MTWSVRPTWPVVVTRPEREAVAWVQALAQQGFEPLALPLMGFAPPTDQAALTQARQAVADFGAAMFVSPQAVHAFWAGYFEKNVSSALDGEHLSAISSDSFLAADWWARNALRCWAPGPGTARALVQQGVPLSRIDQPPAQAAQFDSEALWPVVRAQVVPGLRVLLVRGDSGPPSVPASPDASDAPGAAGVVGGAAVGTGRDWLTRQCQAAGAAVQVCVAYRRGAPAWSVGQRALAQSALARGAVWLLSSSESVGYLKQLLPGQDWHGAAAVATHPRIAASATALGFGRVWQARPDVHEVLATLSGLASGARPP